jgi:hypothetical protein
VRFNFLETDVKPASSEVRPDPTSEWQDRKEGPNRGSYDFSFVD